ncbi:MAG: hypothetical protein ACRCYY_03230 [Trueperaceae bacterium]
MTRKKTTATFCTNWLAMWRSKGLKPVAETKYTLHRVLLFLFIILTANISLAHRFYWNPDSMQLETAFKYDTLPLSSFVIGELEAGETDFLQMPIPESTEAIVALLAPQACSEFLPQLWIVAKTLPETEEAPFEIPEGYKSLQVINDWQPYKDYIITARLGPNVRLALDETNYYLAVYAGQKAGSYIAIKTGRDTIGGTEEGFDALGRFVRCEKVATP